MLEKTLEGPLDCKEIQPVHSEGDQPWDFFGRNDAKAEAPVLWPPHAKSWLIGKDSDAGRDLGAGGEWDDRGWDGWMASLTRWTWVWVNSGRRWWTGRPGVLRFMESQRVGHDWATELNWTERYLSGSVVKNLPANAGSSGLIPGWGRAPGGGNGNSLQYFCLGNPMDRGGWQAKIHGVPNSQARISNWAYIHTCTWLLLKLASFSKLNLMLLHILSR